MLRNGSNRRAPQLLRVSLIVVEFQNDVDFVSKVPLKHTKYI